MVQLLIDSFQLKEQSAATQVAADLFCIYFLDHSKQEPMSLNGKVVLFFAGPLYEDLELWYPKIRLEEEGARTVVAGTGERTYQGKRGYPLTVDASVDEICAPTTSTAW